MLSGFLITSILLAEFHSRKRIDIKNFYLRRARRLLPALFTMLAAVTLSPGSSRATSCTGCAATWSQR